MGDATPTIDVLVVEDDPDDRAWIDELLAGSELAARLAHASDGEDAMTRLQSGNPIPDVVLADLRMPRMDGLALVQALQRKHLHVPIVLMTAYGNEETAVEALRSGAASYVPKRRLEEDLVRSIRQVLDVARATKNRQRVCNQLTKLESDFELENDSSLIGPLIGYLEDDLERMCLFNETDRFHIGMALHEALANALVHGNLEIPSALRTSNANAYLDLVAQRRAQVPYSERHVRVVARETRTEARYRVSDDGPGFDVTRVPDPSDPTNISNASGRGLFLIRTFMDDVRHNANGKEIVMVKRVNQMSDTPQPGS